MNVTIYLFGEFNSGYTQYPDDYTSEIFHNFKEKAKSPTQIVAHRDGNLMYYGYVRQLEYERYIGLCVVLNGLMLSRIDGLFSLFENTISRLVTKGHLVHFNEQGDIVTNVERLYMNKDEVDLLSESLRTGFNRFENYMVALPAISYGVSKDSVKEFVVDDDSDDIIKSSHTNGYTFIYKSKDYDTDQLKSYKSVLAHVNDQKAELLEKLTELQIEYGKTVRQKKQFKIVIILFVVLLGCAAGLFFLNDNLNITRDALSSAKSTIVEQKETLSTLEERMSNMRAEYRNLNERRKEEQSRRIEAENDLDSLKSTMSGRLPFIIKGTTFNYNSGYLSFDYYGMHEDVVTVTVRVYSDKGASFKTSSVVCVEPGDNSTSIYVTRNLNKKYRHSFELLKDNVILGGDRH